MLRILSKSRYTGTTTGKHSFLRGFFGLESTWSVLDYGLQHPGSLHELKMHTFCLELGWALNSKPLNPETLNPKP